MVWLRRAGESANILAAPVPDFFQAAPAPDDWISMEKYSFPRKLER